MLGFAPRNPTYNFLIMEIISEEEFESNVAPLFNKGLTDIITIIKEHDHRFISQQFDYIKIVSNPYSQWFNIEPPELRQALATASKIMGDDFIHLSFVGYTLDPNIPVNFKFPIEELLVKDVSDLKDEAEKSPRGFYGNVLIYSPQGLWAALLEMDCYGTIGMTRDFLTLVRSIYPQLDEELDKQLFDFIRWYNDNPRVPDEWEYVPGDNTGCTGWCRGLMEHLCKRDITPEDEELDDNVDLIAIYRNIKVA
jgi:hypothetical protein